MPERRERRALPARRRRPGSRRETSGKLKVVIVPVKYDADGSGRTPDVSAAQLALYKQTFMARYPATEVEVTARAPWSYASAISANGTGFSAVLNAVTNLRKTDGARSGRLLLRRVRARRRRSTRSAAAAASRVSARVVDSPKTSFLRASVGVGFSGDGLGQHRGPRGRPRARSRARSVRRRAGRRSGLPVLGRRASASWGYDIFAKTFLSPTKGHDMMGYCPNEWVSDYTYTALFDRIAALNGSPASGATGGRAARRHAGSRPARKHAADLPHGHASPATAPCPGAARSSSTRSRPDGEARIATFASASAATHRHAHRAFLPVRPPPRRRPRRPAPAPKATSRLERSREARIAIARAVVDGAVGAASPKPVSC